MSATPSKSRISTHFWSVPQQIGANSLGSARATAEINEIMTTRGKRQADEPIIGVDSVMISDHNHQSVVTNNFKWLKLLCVWRCSDACKLPELPVHRVIIYPSEKMTRYRKSMRRHHNHNEHNKYEDTRCETYHVLRHTKMMCWSANEITPHRPRYGRKRTRNL